MPLSVATMPVISSTWLLETVQTAVPGVAGPTTGPPALAAALVLGVGTGAAAANATGPPTIASPATAAMNTVRTTSGRVVARTSRVGVTRSYQGCRRGTGTV